MTSHPPPTSYSPIFNPLSYTIEDGFLTLAEADNRYFKRTGGVVSGLTTFNAGLYSTAQINITANTDSTSTITGSLITAGGIGIAKTLYVGNGIENFDGTVTNPAYSFANNTNTGIYRIGANNLAVSCNGIKQLDISTSLIQPTNPIRFSTTGNTIIQNSNGLTGMYFTATPGIGFTTNNSTRLEMSSNGINCVSQVQGKNGAVNDPSYSWFNEQTSGLYRAGSNDLRFCVNSTDKWRWTSSTNHSLQQLNMNNNNIINAPQVGNTAGNFELAVNSTGAGGTITLTGGTDLLQGTAGGSAGVHLKLIINGTAYKIALLNN